MASSKWLILARSRDFSLSARESTNGTCLHPDPLPQAGEGSELAPARFEAAAHAGAAEGGARAGAFSRNRLNARPHFVQPRLARRVPSIRVRTVRRDLVGKRDTHFVERGFVDFASAFALCASARRASRPGR